MSELSNFDQFIKKKMDDYSPPVPEHIWENIMAEKKKKRPIPFLFKFFNNRNILVLAALLLLVAGTVYTFNQTGRSTAAKDITTANETNNDNNATLNNTTETIDQPSNTATTQNTLAIDQNDNTLENSTIKNQVEGSEAQNNLPKEIKSNHSLNQHHSAGSFSKKGKIKTSNINADYMDENDIVQTLSKTKQAAIAEELLLLKMLYYPEKNKAAYLLINKVSANFLLPPCPEIEKNAAGNKDYIEAYVGPDYAYKSYSDTSNSLLMQKRKESISFRSAFSAGFRYTRVFSNGVSVRGGINFSQVNEKFTYIQSNIVQVTYIIDAATGDTTGSYITNGSRYKTTYNHYRTIDAPLLFGFETGNGRVHANLNAGVVFNVRSWQTGETIGLDSSSQPIIIATGKGNAPYQYKTNIGAGFMTAASIYYKLNDRFHLLAEPYWRYNFSPMSKEALSLQEKYSTIGLRLGIRIDLRY